MTELSGREMPFSNFKNFYFKVFIFLNDFVWWCCFLFNLHFMYTSLYF